tara:strand:+ start:99 stop:404 length:306 start_codon:yes stop_codon:yes gene_type:complete
LFSGAKNKIAINTNVNEYEIFKDGQSYGEAQIIKVKKGDIVTVKSEGYNDYSVVIDGAFNPITLLNLISPFSLVGIIVDAVTGAINKVDTPMINAKMKKPE